MRLVLVSNRLPITVENHDGALEVVPSTGGLASALTRLHERTNGVWVGWPGETGKINAEAKAKLAAELDARRAVPLALSTAEIAQYYDGFSNGVLWPLFHYQLDKVDLQAERDFRTYEEVNRRFAQKIAELHQPGDMVWIHDYQLTLVPGFLRELVPDARIGFFLHIPFPAADVFRILPWRSQILRSLLCADLLGFHTAGYRHNFAHAAALVLNTDLAYDAVHVGDHTCRLGVFPISIETSAFDDAATTDAVLEEMHTLRDAARGKKIVLGVDRLDYTKGIPRRLLAFDRLLSADPSWVERVHFVQIAVPSREKVAAYAELRRTVNELAGRINAQHGTPLSSPLQVLYRSVTFEQLVGLYRAADVMLVTPLRDGMNLVAKEYVASRVDDDGVLVLSELAGAAAELREALQVNPYDLEATADTLRRALEMAPAERESRMRALRGHVRSFDVHRWAQRFVEELGVPTAIEGAVEAGTEVALEEALRTFESARRRTLLLDYDGTLVPHVSLPSLATPEPDLLGLLARLAEVTELHIITGRDRPTIEAWLGHLPIGIHAEHGFWSRTARGAWETNRQEFSSWKASISPALEQWVAATPGALIEEKSVSLAVHYRNVDPSILPARLSALRDELRSRLPDAIELLSGAKVIELRLRGVHKGLAAERVVRGAAAIMAIGDDRTDEDLFAALPPDAITIKVGSGKSRARYAVPDVAAVRKLLGALLQASPQQVRA